MLPRNTLRLRGHLRVASRDHALLGETPHLTKRLAPARTNGQASLALALVRIFGPVASCWPAPVGLREGHTATGEKHGRDPQRAENLKPDSRHELRCREVLERTGKPRRYLLCSRRDFDPHLWARWSRRVVSFGARAVVPVRLRLLVHDDGRWLYHDLRWVVVGRVVIRRGTPPRTPPGTDDDDAVPMKVAVESVVPVETVAAAVAAAMASASMTHCGA